MMEEPEDIMNQASGSDDEETEGKRFFACYLLTSLSPRHKGRTYIGFTVNPRRRIRQHNGELKSGAWRTKSKRPWEMVICIYGFPTNVSALQFEWAWQHPRESLAVRNVAASFKSLSGVTNKIKLAYSMLNLSNWQSMNITVNYFSTKYKKYSAGCPSLPDCMKVEMRQMDELPCYAGFANFIENNNWDCDIVGDKNGTAHCLDESRNHERTDQEENSLVRPVNLRKSRDCDLRVNYKESPKKSSSSDLLGCSVSEGTINIEECNVELKRNAELQQIRPTVIINDEEDDNKLPSSIASREIEIIDIFTPSPEQSATFGKRRRIASEIIDLTESPIFLQL